MDARSVIRYGVKKLGIKCADGAEQIAIEAYLSATEKAQAANRKTVQTRAADSAVASSPDIDQYIAQGSK
jgi:phosphosulfolactate synthase (CoM biosynthesis protein A)